MDTFRPPSLVLLVRHQPRVLPQLLPASLVSPSTGDPMDCKAWAAEMGTVCGLQTFKDMEVLFTPYPSQPWSIWTQCPCWSLAVTSRDTCMELSRNFLKARETCWSVYKKQSLK